MVVSHYTGQQGRIYLTGHTLLASAIFDIPITRGAASHARGGAWSDLSAPGKIGPLVITAKGILRNANLIGGMLTDASTSGQAAVLVAADTIVADTVVPCSTSPSSPSRIRFAFVKGAGAGITTAGQIIVFGTDANGAKSSEIIEVGLTTDATKNFDGKILFATVTHFSVIDLVIDGAGTGELRSLAGAASYTVGFPTYYDLECTVLDDVTGDYILATFHHAWISKGTFASGDASKMLDEDVAFTILDPDADVAIADLNT
jgi:hypothetical protein